MHPSTKNTLDKLDTIEWFSKVGQKSDRLSTATILSSWDEAISSCSTIEWENLLLEAANQYCERLAERSRERFNRWNDVVEEMKNYTVDLVKKKIKKTVEENNLPDVFEDTVQWDILHLAMEAEYADVYPPGFYASQSYWYYEGHFPCGWNGEFPEGNLIIY